MKKKNDRNITDRCYGIINGSWSCYSYGRRHNRGKR